MRSKQRRELLERIDILDSHVKELLELLRYDGKTAPGDIQYTGQSLDKYQCSSVIATT